MAATMELGRCKSAEDGIDGNPHFEIQPKQSSILGAYFQGNVLRIATFVIKDHFRTEL